MIGDNADTQPTLAEQMDRLGSGGERWPHRAQPRELVSYAEELQLEGDYVTEPPRTEHFRVSELVIPPITTIVDRDGVTTRPADAPYLANVPHNAATCPDCARDYQLEVLRDMERQVNDEIRKGVDQPDWRLTVGRVILWVSLAFALWLVALLLPTGLLALATACASLAALGTAVWTVFFGRR